MSRKKAKNELNMEEYKAAMSGVYTTSVNEATLNIDFESGWENVKAGTVFNLFSMSGVMMVFVWRLKNTLDYIIKLQV